MNCNMSYEAALYARNALRQSLIALSVCACDACDQKRAEGVQRVTNEMDDVVRAFREVCLSMCDEHRPPDDSSESNVFPFVR